MLNALVRRIVGEALLHYLPDTVQDQMKATPIKLFEVAINQSLDHCYTSC